MRHSHPWLIPPPYPDSSWRVAAAGEHPGGRIRPGYGARSRAAVARLPARHVARPMDPVGDEKGEQAPFLTLGRAVLAQGGVGRPRDAADLVAGPATPGRGGGASGGEGSRGRVAALENLRPRRALHRSAGTDQGPVGAGGVGVAAIEVVAGRGDRHARHRVFGGALEAVLAKVCARAIGARAREDGAGGRRVDRGRDGGAGTKERQI
ncbi:hypothetical protein DFJ74DRAFT_683956 [Hyaloraphidium curvatum]|nr:hypothetical protein DFJ74DRAFT_683956 [Hyaloraphidium curvatum]